MAVINALLDIREVLESNYSDALSYPITYYQVNGIDLVEFDSTRYFLFNLVEDYIVIFAALKPFEFENTSADITPFGVV